MTRRGIIGVPPDPRRKGGEDPLAHLRKDGVQPQGTSVPLSPAIARVLGKIGTFKTILFYVPALDMLVYLEKDRSYTTKYMPGSNISLLYDNGLEGKLVGVGIEGASTLMSKSILEKLPNFGGSSKPRKKKR